MAAIPDGYLDLFTTKAPLAHVATVMADGSPQVTPVWFDYVGGKVRINTASTRVKARVLTEGAKVALSIVDPDNDYRYIQVRGVVSKVTGEGSEAHIDLLAKKYLDKDVYPWRRAGEQRLVIEIVPEKTQTMG
jgi:PPOX class probable F420-dependent enzyme